MVFGNDQGVYDTQQPTYLKDLIDQVALLSDFIFQSENCCGGSAWRAIVSTKHYQQSNIWMKTQSLEEFFSILLTPFEMVTNDRNIAGNRVYSPNFHSGQKLLLCRSFKSCERSFTWWNSAKEYGNSNTRRRNWTEIVRFWGLQTSGEKSSEGKIAKIYMYLVVKVI